MKAINRNIDGQVLYQHIQDHNNPHQVSAEQVPYDNSESKLTAEDVQAALDEIVARETGDALTLVSTINISAGATTASFSGLSGNYIIMLNNLVWNGSGAPNPGWRIKNSSGTVLHTVQFNSFMQSSGSSITNGNNADATVHVLGANISLSATYRVACAKLCQSGFGVAGAWTNKDNSVGIEYSSGVGVGNFRRYYCAQRVSTDVADTWELYVFSGTGAFGGGTLKLYKVN